MVKKICDKKIGDIIYTLKYFKGDNKYVIYKQDNIVMNDGCVHRIPEEAIFDNEKDARKYLEKLK